MTREPNASIITGHAEYSDEIDTLLMIEADWTKNKISIPQLKEDYLFLLNVVKSTLHDTLIGNIWRNRNMNNLSVNVRNGEIRLKQFLGETLVLFQENN